MYNALIFLHVIGIGIGFINLIVVSQQKSSENQKVLMMASACGMITILSYLFELIGTEFNEMILAAQFGYIGKCYMLVLMLLFAKNYCSVNLSSYIIQGLFFFNSFILLIVLTCRYHSFYYKTAELYTDGLFPYIKVTNGIGHHIYMFVTFCMVIYYSYIVIKKLKDSVGIERKKLFLLLLIGIIPTLVMALYITGLFDAVDLTPIGIIISCSIITFNVINYGLLDTMDVAKESIIKHANEGLMITDENNNLIYANPVAVKIIQRANEQEVVPDFVKWAFSQPNDQGFIKISQTQYEVRVYPLMEGTQCKGYICWIYDESFIDAGNKGVVL